MQALFVGIALIAGVVLGYIIRSASVRRELALLEQRNRESLDALNALHKQLTQSQSESAARAGFESLAIERAANIAQLNVEISTLRFDISANVARELSLGARVSELEAQLKAEQDSMPEKMKLLKDAENVLSNHFEVLAGKV